MTHLPPIIVICGAEVTPLLKHIKLIELLAIKLKMISRH